MKKIAGLLWALAAAPALVFPLPFDASLSFVAGTVEVKRAAGGDWQAAVLNDPLVEGDALRTGEASEADIRLSDGSTFKLKEATELELSALQIKGAVKQVKGSLFLILKSIFSKDNPFIITTPTATASIRGTALAVRLKEGQSSFAVVQGKIGVLGSAGEEVDVVAGNFSTVMTGAAAGAAQTIPADALKNLEGWGGVKYEGWYVDQVPVAEAQSLGASGGAGGSATGTGGTTPPPADGVPTDSAKAEAGKEAPSGGEASAAAPGDAGGDKITWGLGLGTVTVDGKQWSRLSLRPDIPIGKFGIGLDLELFIDDQGEISNKGWAFDNATQAFESLQRKIYYLRYGHPGEKFYARVGALDHVTLGYGLIMYGYSNALQYPDIKKTGLHLELNGLTGLGLGVQGVINNFQDFQRDGALVGLRASVHPIGFLGLPIIKNLEVGATYVSDMNQRAVLRDRDGDKVPDLLDKAPSDRQWAIDVVQDTARYRPTTLTAMRYDDSVANAAAIRRFKEYIEGEDPFSMWGADAGLPLVQSKILSVITYGQVAFVMDDASTFDTSKAEGWGFSFPGVQVGVGPLKVNVEYRHFEDRFKGEYFDQTYELDRMKQYDDTLLAKETTLPDSVSMNGVFGRASLNIANLVMVGASYQYMTVTDKRDSAVGPDANQEFTSSASVGETIRNILRKVKVEDVNAYFTKKNIGTWLVDVDAKGEPVYDAFLEATPSILMGYKVGFQLGANMVLYWDNQYTYAVDEESTGLIPELKLTQRRNIEAVLKF